MRILLLVCALAYAGAASSQEIDKAFTISPTFNNAEELDEWFADFSAFHCTCKTRKDNYCKVQKRVPNGYCECDEEPGNISTETCLKVD